MDQSSLLLFHKIHCGAVSIEKDKYMTPTHSSKTTRSLHTLKDFKNAKIEIHKINNFLMYQFY